MKQAVNGPKWGYISERVLRGAQDMLEMLRARLSLLPECDLEVMKRLERPAQHDLAVSVTNHLMSALGHDTQPSEPRFDKTRRRAAKKQKRRGRGVLKPEDEALLKGTNDAPST